MKVWQVNSVYNNSSTGKITHSLHEYLIAGGHESKVFFGHGEVVTDARVSKLCSDLYMKANHLRARVTGMMYGGCSVSTAKLLRLIAREKPDIVHLQCINGYFVNIYQLVAWLRDHGIRTVLTLHAEFMYTANCGHALACDKWLTGCGACPDRRRQTESYFFDRTAKSFRRMQAAFAGFDDRLAVVSVSPWLMERAKRSPILADKKHFCVYNGLDCAVFCPRGEESEAAIRNRYGQGGEKIILHVTSFFSDDPANFKGGAYLIRLAERMKDTPVRFLVAAGHTTVSRTLPENMTLLGHIREQDELARLYGAADLSVIVSQKETFSMTVAESLCCGTPVVGFCAGAPERIALPDSSEFVAHGDMDALETAVRRWLEKSHDRTRIAEAAKAVYSNEHMNENYMEIYRSLVWNYPPTNEGSSSFCTSCPPSF